MSTDKASPNSQSQGTAQAPIDTTTTSSSAQNTPIHTGVPLSTVTRPSIQPHQGHPAESSSTSGSGHSSIRSTSDSASGSRSHKSPRVQNVFSNDGSFLERFQRLKREEDEKKKQQELLERKKQFADRFKHRGKRGHSEMSESSGSAEASGSGSGSGRSESVSDGGALTPDVPSKKPKVDGSSSSSSVEPKPLNEYQKECSQE